MRRSCGCARSRPRCRLVRRLSAPPVRRRVLAGKGFGARGRIRIDRATIYLSVACSRPHFQFTTLMPTRRTDAEGDQARLPPDRLQFTRIAAGRVATSIPSLRPQRSAAAASLRLEAPTPAPQVVLSVRSSRTPRSSSPGRLGPSRLAECQQQVGIRRPWSRQDVFGLGPSFRSAPARWRVPHPSSRRRVYPEEHSERRHDRGG